MSFSATWPKPSGSGANGCWYFGCHVAASEPKVLPWNELVSETISCAPRSPP